MSFLSSFSTSFFFFLSIAVFFPAFGQTELLSNVNLTNAEYKNVIILLTNNDPETFPYDQAYGNNNYWTKWDVLQNDDYTFSFHLNGKYLSAAEDGFINVATSIGEQEKFRLEAYRSAYYIKTWRNTYMSATGSGWKDVKQSDTAGTAEEWYFTKTQDPASGLDNVNVSNWLYKGIVILLTGNDPETFPFQQAYGMDNYWTKWDVIVNSDGTYSFHVNGKYLADDRVGGIAVVSSITNEAKFTLVADGSAYQMMTYSGVYVASVGTGWKDMVTTPTASDATAWQFLDRYTVDASFPIPVAEMATGTVNNVDENWDGIAYPTQLSSAPGVIADMQTFNGTDPAGLRIDGAAIDGFDVFVEEEQSKDSEIVHNNETIAYAAITEGALFDENGDVVGESGSVTFTQTDGDTWFTYYPQYSNYSNPVVVMTISTYNGVHKSHMRIKDVSGQSFTFQLEEWDYQDGSHTEETATFLLVEAGAHTLEDGTKVSAQAQNIDDDFEIVGFPPIFTGTPVVFSQAQTVNGGSSIVTRQKNVNMAFVQIRLQEQESDNGSHNNETVGVISIQQ